jgi:2-oxoglutarate ferredoxin oxidoreductase subunit alpha
MVRVGLEQTSIEVMFGGQAGDGSLTTGDAIAAIFKRCGLAVYTYKDFPSRIRGGHTNYVIRAGSEPDYGLADAVDALVAFDLEAVATHIDELRPGGFVIFDTTSAALPQHLRRADVRWYEIPLARIAKEELGREIVRNTIALGALAALTGIDSRIVHAEVRRTYQRKGEAVVDLNLRAVDAGERAVAHSPAEPARASALRDTDDGRLMMMGNDAIAFGALVAGCRFMAGYPITPATDILEWMARELPRFGGVAVQAEDELAAINMVLGAAFAGVRAMTATSGPGQALMTEAIGLAGMLEIPVVVVECARTGPSTGMPTKTEQSTLNHLIYSGHGEIPRVVLAPGTVRESFELTVSAFNLAERYQIPVFVLTEQALCQSKATLTLPDFDTIKVERGKLIADGSVTFGVYERFAPADGGVSPRVVPGVPGGMHLAPGAEHDPVGVVTEDAPNRMRMMEKRMGKLEAMRDELPRPIVHGVADADIAIVGYGSNRGPIAEAVDRLCRAGIPVRFLQLRTLWPFPAGEIRAFVRGAQHVFVVENTYTGQLEALIRGVVGPLDLLHGVRKYDGRPFRPIEIIEPIERVAHADEFAPVQS